MDAKDMDTLSRLVKAMDSGHQANFVQLGLDPASVQRLSDYGYVTVYIGGSCIVNDEGIEAVR